MDFLKLTPDPLSIDELKDQVADPACGAISFFVGTTRNNFEGRNVCRLEYEAYNEMAEKELKKLCKEVRNKWNIKNIGIYHRLGVVGIKEASVIVAVSSEHRRESLDAVSFLIDSLKALVPIWKREVYDDEKSEWKSNKECRWKKTNPPGEGNTNLTTPPIIENKILGVNIKKEVEDIDFDIPVNEIKSEPLNDSMEYKDILSEDLKMNLVDPSFIQIGASKEEIERRVQAFQERKREELNITNIQEFCVIGSDEDEENSCARTTAVVLRSLGSKTHLKLTKVENKWGPQTDGFDPGSMTAAFMSTKNEVSDNDADDDDDDDMSGELSASITNGNEQNANTARGKVKKDKLLLAGVDERLSNMEEFLNLNPEERVPPSVYARLKRLEDKILFLESISPEYFNSKRSCLLTLTNSTERRNTPEEKSANEDDDFSLDDIDMKIFEAKKRLKAKQLGINY